MKISGCLFPELRVTCTVYVILLSVLDICGSVIIEDFKLYVAGLEVTDVM
jgi:hypothetical protein